MRAPETFETDRLKAERLAWTHLDEYARFFQNPADMTWLGGVRSTADVVGGWTRGARLWLHRGFGRWVFRLRGSRGLAGYGGLREATFFGTPALDVSYALTIACQGRGLGTEMARAIVRIGFNDLGADQLTAVTLPHNIRSRRVLEKLGFRCEGETRNAGLPHSLYRRSR